MIFNNRKSIKNKVRLNTNINHSVMTDFIPFRRFSRIILSLLLLSALSIGAFSQRAKAKKRLPAPKEAVTVPSTESRTLHSALYDQDFEIMVRLPVNYHPDSSVIYPVMYVTDANRCFPMVANISFLLGFPKTDFPEVIVVGIGYKIKGLEDWAAWRTRDLTPTNVPATDKGTSEMLSRLTGREISVISGGAEKFLDFIISELVPFIESDYHVSKTDKTLAGYSYGGLFAIYAMLEKPGSFNKYFAGSPSIGWDKGVLFRFEEEYSGSHNDLNARLFMTAGSLEGQAMPANIEKMKSQLLARNYPNFRVESHVFENESHVSCMPSAFMRAFVTLYK